MEETEEKISIETLQKLLSPLGIEVVSKKKWMTGTTWIPCLKMMKANNAMHLKADYVWISADALFMALVQSKHITEHIRSNMGEDDEECCINNPYYKAKNIEEALIRYDLLKLAITEDDCHSLIVF